MKKLKYISLIFVFGILVVSCKKSNPQPATTTTTTTSAAGTNCSIATINYNDSTLYTCVYDGTNRLIKVYYKSLIPAPYTPLVDSILYSYDSQNKLVSMKRSYFMTKFYYDQSGRISIITVDSTSQSAGLFVNFEPDSTVYQYVNNNTINSTLYSRLSNPSTPITYRLDSINELIELDNSGNLLKRYRNPYKSSNYDGLPFSFNRDTMLLIEDYTYDYSHPALNNNTSFWENINDIFPGQPIQTGNDYYYQYVNNGISPQAIVTLSGNYTNTYDNSGHLIQATVGSGATAYKWVYTYTCK